MINEIGKVISLNNTKKTLCLCGFVFSLLFFFMLIACGGKVEEDSKNVTAKKDILPVDFQYEEVKRIKLDNSEFDNFNLSYIAYVDLEKIYLADCKMMNLISIDRQGDYLNSFIKKGQGPGEFQNWYHVVFKDNCIWAIGDGGRKICKFTKKGKLIFEKKVKNYYENFYPIDDETFFAKVTKWENEKVKNTVGIFNYKDELLKEFVSNDKPEMISLHINKAFMSIFVEGGIKPKLINAFNMANDLIVYADSSKYNISIGKITDSKFSILKRDVKNFPVTEKNRNHILEQLSGVLKSQEAKNEVLRQIPENLTVIDEIVFSPKGLVIVRRPKGNGVALLDIFDKEGNLLSIYNVSKDFDIFKGYLFEDKYYKINETDEYYELILYKLKNLPIGW